jgi:hypothetical protein
VNYFVVAFATILFLAGIGWLSFNKRIILWFARNMLAEEKVIQLLSSAQGSLVLWRLRMSGILWIILALFLFIMAFKPAWLADVPSYIVIILIALPIIAGFVLVRVAFVLVRRKNSHP